MTSQGGDERSLVVDQRSVRLDEEGDEVMAVRLATGAAPGSCGAPSGPQVTAPSSRLPYLSGRGPPTRDWTSTACATPPHVGTSRSTRLAVIACRRDPVASRTRILRNVGLRVERERIPVCLSG